jgi:hypothetical protein
VKLTVLKMTGLNYGVLGDGGEELNIDVYGITKKSNQTANRNHK